MKPVCVARRRLLLGALTLALAACASTPPPAQPARPKVALALGGGAASSMTAGVNAEDLDFASVQRGNPEIQRRAQEVIDRCW